MDSQPVEELTEAGIGGRSDRRALLKKAAVIGTAAWVTPLIATSPASAGVCTPKCTPTSEGAPGVNSVCGGNVNNLAARLTFGAPLGCPCGGATVRTFTSTTGFAGLTATFNPNNVVLRALVANTVYSGTVTMTLACTDRDGDVITKTCTATVGFTTAAAATACTTGAGGPGFEYLLSGVSSSMSCNTPCP